MNEEGKTVIIVTHDAKVAEKCDRIIYVRDGVVEGGSETEQDMSGMGSQTGQGVCGKGVGV